MWGVARALGGSVVLRIEDHDRQRSRAVYERALLDDLDLLGLRPDRPTTDDLRMGASDFRQSDTGEVYAAALEGLRAAGRIYACACSRATFRSWADEHGAPFSGIGCPGECRARGVAEEEGVGLRAALGAGDESWVDLLVGPLRDAVAPAGDLLVRDRLGNWTYGFCVVVDDVRHGVDLVIRGRDLLHATATQIRLGRLLGRDRPPAFLHHPLIRKPSGAKLSKADGDTAIRSLLEAGRTPAELLGEATAAVGLIETARPLRVEELAGLFR